jgi:hypothetical protein
MKEAMVEQSEVLLCNECEEIIYTCDGCKDYFVPDESCFCDEETGKHFCEECSESKKGGKDI